MSAHQMARMAELENQAFSLMGRLHVVLRRETGRITDVEYMRIDPAYCHHLIQLALQSGQSDLQKIGERLHDIYFGEAGLFILEHPKPPLLARFSATHATAAAPPAATPPAHAGSKTMQAFPGSAIPDPAPPEKDRHYVGRLR